MLALKWSIGSKYVQLPWSLKKKKKMTDLEEDGLAVAANGAAHVLGAGQRGVAGDVLEHLGELAGAVVHHVPVHAVVVRNLLQQRFQRSSVRLAAHERIQIFESCSRFHRESEIRMNEWKKKLKRMTVRMAGEERRGEEEKERRKNLVIAVPAGVEEHLLLPVLLGVQDVVAAKKRHGHCYRTPS